MSKQNLILLVMMLIHITMIPPTWAVYDSAVVNQNKPLKIERIVPNGFDVPAGRQIVITFNQAVVPLGKMERETKDIPITITPELNCQWRWLNTSSLACELDDKDALQAATYYEITVNPGIMTVAQQTLSKLYYHDFTTERPAVYYTEFERWNAPGLPKIRVRFNQKVTRDSVAKSLYMKKLNKRQRTPVIVEFPPVEEAVENSATATNKEITINDVWLVTPKTAFPVDSEINLHIQPGLESTAGDELGIEEKVVQTLHTFPEFKFLGIECSNLNDGDIYFYSKKKKKSRCNPLRGVALRFNTPVQAKMLKDNLIFKPDLAGGRKDYDPWENSSNYSALDYSHDKNQIYRVWLPEYLKAYQGYEVLMKAEADFKDEFGRSLAKKININFATDHRKPNYNFEHEISVLETGVDSEVPIIVTNLDKLSLYYHTLTSQGWSNQKRKRINIPKVQDVAFRMPLDIRNLISSKSGVVQGYFKTSPNINNEYATNYNRFFAQVTPFYLQAKLGHYNSLVWVTDFATGLPVKNAKISIYLDNNLADKKLAKPLAITTTNDKGIAILPGTQTLDPKLERAYVYGYDQEETRFFIRCEKDRRIALLPLDSQFRVSFYDFTTDYDFYPDMQSKYGHIHTWGTTAQGIYKVGDTIQYKFFVRDQSNKTFIAAPEEKYNLQVKDPMGKIVHEVKEIKLSEFGSYHNEFIVSKNAAVGWYDFQLKADFTNEIWYPLQVLVSDFTPSPFRVNTELRGKIFQVGDQVNIDTEATLHSGGPYTEAQTNVTAILTPRTLQPSHPQAKGFWFDVLDDDIEDQTVFSVEDQKLNNKGRLQTHFKLSNDLKVLYGQLRVESAVRDDRGKDVANLATAQYVGRDRFVGLKETSWLLTAGEPAKVMLLVVNDKQQPVANTKIAVKIERRHTMVAKVKSAGNAYLNQYQHKWVEVAKCNRVSTKQAIDCNFTPSKAGAYKVTATIKDSQNRSHSTELHQWAIGQDYVMWETTPGHGLEIIPEQESYKVNEVARYMVKNPYPSNQGVQALITVERFGTMKHWVQNFKKSIEVIEVPVEPDYAPGFFVSVTVMSPRVDKPIDKNLVDLGKPAFRMGYVETPVTEPYKKITVEIKTDKPVYRPGEQVTVNLQAQLNQSDSEQPIELAITVLDESVFDLLTDGRDYFDPYKGFYTLDSLDMANFSLLMKLVGRQKFEKKGATAGGDGGGTGLSMRSLFKFVSYWNPAVKTDADGKTQIQFTAPDNLTGWRIFAMAVTPGEYMGLGDVNFKVNRPIEIRPVLPNQVLTGDQFQAGFSVMNRTDNTVNIKLNIAATGPVIPIKAKPSVMKRFFGFFNKSKPEPEASLDRHYTMLVKPYQRIIRWMPLETKEAGMIQFTVSAMGGNEQDKLQKTLEILARKPAITVATYGTTIKDVVTESVKFPTGIYTDVGGLNITASPTVISGIEGAFEYMRDYPYSCWEQKLTKGTMASHYNNLQDYLAAEITWEGSQTLPTETLQLANEYQAPNGGMAYFVAKDERVSPYLSAYTALALNWLRTSGQTAPEIMENKLHDYLSLLLRKNVMPDFYSKGMASSVRAVALAALAKRGKITRSDIRRYQRHVNSMDLFGKAMFLSAALQIPGTGEIRAEVAEMILSHANQTSGKISFNEELDSGYKRILSSSLRTQCAILTSLSQYDALMSEQSKIGDIPFKLVRHITQTRKNRGRWENTQENMFCLNALIEYSRVYENEKPEFRLSINSKQLSFAGKTEAEFNDVKDAPVVFSHPMTASDPGKQAVIELKREGQGRLYYNLRMSYAEKSEQATAINAGIQVNREYHVERNGKWQLLNSPMRITTGELVRVDVYLSLPAPRHFVVVNDPVPGGLEPVNRDLATTSQLDADKAKMRYAGNSLWFNHDDWQEYGVSWWNFYHKELRHHAAIFYSDYLPAGNYHLSYIAQAIAPGEFNIMATHSEEMYDPEVFGNAKPAKLTVIRN